MYFWKLSKTFTLSQASDWDKITQEVLGEPVHPDRRRGFILAREALRLTLCDLGLNPKVSDLTFVNYSTLTTSPQFTISLSHSKEAGAAIVAPRNEYLSVGIDIESLERQVKEAIAKRIAHPSDAKLRNLELWCLKEAVFKCLMNTGKFTKPFDFSEILIGDEAWSHSPSQLSGGYKLETHEGHVVAMAYARKLSNSFVAVIPF